MNESRKNLNEEAWEKLFEKYNILAQIKKNGAFQISASNIKEVREPRLMAKFDHSINLPPIFAENGLSILPITRGDYVIAPFEAYHEFEPDITSVKRTSLPLYIQSLDTENIPSEAIALNCAYASGIVEDFLDDENILSTTSGRMGSGDFSFNINLKSNPSYHINVSNSQIEIDAGYEGVKSLTLFEAKRDLSKDFLVRQLYYPYRTWKNRISKPVRTVFMVYSNGIYRLYEYVFEDPDNYSSITLKQQKNYTVDDTTITADDIQKVLYDVVPIKEPEISFPQADSFDRVINLCELLNDGPLNREEVTQNYAFDARQTNYYTDAGRYLGLINKNKEDGIPLYCLSRKGSQILSLPFRARQLSFCECILGHGVFASTLKLYFKTGLMPGKNEIINIMQQSNLYKVKSDNTFERRSSTVRGWIRWIVGLINA